MEIKPVSQEEYIFIIYHRRLKFRFRIIGRYSVETKQVFINSVEEVFSEKLKEIKEPEQPKVRIIKRDSLTKNVEAKEVFDYLYKIQPTFRQTLVDKIQVEESKDIKKLFIITKKDGKDYRMVVMKEKDENKLNLIDEGFVTSEKSTATIVT